MFEYIMNYKDKGLWITFNFNQMTIENVENISVKVQTFTFICLHRRNEDGDQGGPWASPPIRSKIGKIRSKMGVKSFKIGPFLGLVIHENTCCKTKFKL